jgi:hypothetical protein
MDGVVCLVSPKQNQLSEYARSNVGVEVLITVTM